MGEETITPPTADEITVQSDPNAPLTLPAPAAAQPLLDLRSRILSAPKLAQESLDVPEWGANVIIQELNGRDHAQFAQTLASSKSDPHAMEAFYGNLCILSVLDPSTGAKLFQPADRDALLSGSGTALERVAQVAMRVSGLNTDVFQTAAKD